MGGNCARSREADNPYRWGQDWTAVLQIWNIWRDHNGTTQAWIGNSGLKRIEEGVNVVKLSCSDGYGDPNFRNLVVEIHLGDAPAP